VTTASGVLLLDKETGWTSHDVVAKLRGILGERRIGHAGTLDPMATGLLVVAVGPATRLLRFGTRGEKRYTGTFRLGVATDTLDADGTVTRTVPVPELSEPAMAAAAAESVGESLQRPPMVSAVRVGGRRLYEIARAGGEVERDPRPISVSSFVVRATDVPLEWQFTVACSPGTFVRVLVADLAERVGTVGHLTSLRRTGSGAHEVANALTLAQVAATVTAGASVLRAPLELLGALPRVTLNDTETLAARQGRRLAGDGALSGDVAALDESGQLIGVLIADGGSLKPSIILTA
jgi:tRNA pseudouridine55 synthase